MKIGLTGSIACGKSTVSAYLRELSLPVVDADAISRALTAPGGEALPALREAFGERVFCGDVLDRRALASLVFSDERERERLNALLHPRIREQIVRELCACPGPIAFADIPLLFECGMETLFDRVWVVTASRETQILRLHERDGLSREEACARIDAQMSQEEKIRRADAVIDTNGPVEATRRQIDSLLSQFDERSAR
ncbi:MAG: dephospho-CoA kinase [Clostridiales bacterium]|nr:dephospho-CoA kinase [Clostridiales bacterium]MDY5515148.1 dephospho-CoA kinase [Candidatus Ventricola sp.]